MPPKLPLDILYEKKNPERSQRQGNLQKKKREELYLTSSQKQSKQDSQVKVCFSVERKKM